MKLNEIETTPAECPNCFHVVDRASCLGREAARPSPGDATMCIRCGTMLVFEEREQLRLPTEEEAREFQANADVQLLQRAWRVTRKDQPPPHVGGYEKGRLK